MQIHEKNVETLATNLQPMFKEQAAQILQLQNDSTRTRTQVLEHGKVQDRMSKESKSTRSRW